MWVPETRHMSCDVLVFVKEPAEPVVSSDVGGVGVGLAMFGGTEWESGGAVRADSATRRRVPGGSSIYGADPGDEVVALTGMAPLYSMTPDSTCRSWAPHGGCPTARR